MFLNMLTTDEKINYLKLAVLAANVNGTVEEEEKAFISGYEREMDIVSDTDFFELEIDEESVFQVFSNSEKSHKKIVLFELIGLLTCDRLFDEDEKNFVFRFCDRIGVSLEDIDTISQLSTHYFDMITAIAETLFIE